MKQRADGRWQKKITLSNGKAKFLYSTAKTEREATKDFNKQMLALEEEHRISMNFDRVAEAWAEERFPTLQNNTISSYTKSKKEAVEYFKQTPVADITSTNAKAYIDYLVRKNYAKKTIKEKYAILKQILFFALANGYIEKDPCALVQFKVPKSAITPKRQAATEFEEKIIKELPDDFGFFAKFLLYTGCRRGEVCALTPGDIDFENRTVHISKSVEWLGNAPNIKKCPKTDAGIRNIPLPNILVPELKKRAKNKYIFENENHDLLRKSDIEKMWNALKKKTGIACTPHQLRHSYATMLFDAGIDVKTAQRWLGHADIKTTLDTYTHLSNMRQEQSVNKLFEFIEKK